MTELEGRGWEDGRANVKKKQPNDTKANGTRPIRSGRTSWCATVRTTRPTTVSTASASTWSRRSLVWPVSTTSSSWVRTASTAPAIPRPASGTVSSVSSCNTWAAPIFFLFVSFVPTPSKSARSKPNHQLDADGKWSSPQRTKTISQTGGQKKNTRRRLFFRWLRVSCRPIDWAVRRWR